jgi:uncharacterized C2H2 Zn-finger protein
MPKNGLSLGKVEAVAASLDVPEGYHWPHEAFRSLDVLTRCPICGEHFRAPVLLECGHSFCSECIRRALVYRSECPQCRAPASAGQLRRNRLVQDVTTAWQQARECVLTRFSPQEHAGNTECRSSKLEASTESGLTVRERTEAACPVRAAALTAQVATRRGARSAPVPPDEHTAAVSAVWTDRQHQNWDEAGVCCGNCEESASSAVSMSKRTEPSHRFERSAERAGAQRPNGGLSGIAAVPQPLPVFQKTDDIYAEDWSEAAPTRTPAALPGEAARAMEPRPRNDAESTATSGHASFTRRASCERIQQRDHTKYVECPICNRAYPPAFIQVHVNECLDQLDAVEASGFPEAGSRALAKATNTLEDEYPMRKIPEVWYDGLTERRLREMIRALGMKTPPAWLRNRRGLIYLHREYVIRHNAECDVEPVTARKQRRNICREVEELAWFQIESARRPTRPEAARSSNAT